MIVHRIFRSMVDGQLVTWGDPHQPMRIVKDKGIYVSWQKKAGVMSPVYFKEFLNWITHHTFSQVEFRVQDLRVRVRDLVWKRIDD